MGEHLIFDRKDEKKNTVLSGTPISTDALDKIQQAKVQDMKAAQKRVDEEKVKAVN